jgi:hypothetical protein
MTTDILFDDNDVIVKDGDFFISDSDQQHIKHILIADKGQFRQWPLIGVGIRRQSNGSTNKQDLKQLIRVQLRSDNFTVKKLEISGTMDITIDAKRNE